jgi:two-component system LytT family response regulator
MMRRSSVNLRVAIVDDEPQSRERLRTLLAEDPDVHIVAECEDGAEALSALSETDVSLLFLDMQMPELDGFEVLDGLADLKGEERLPAVVFVTADDEPMLRTFEAGAQEYLLKPITQDGFARTLARTKERLSQPGGPQTADEELRELLHVLRAERDSGNGYAKRFAVRLPRAISFVHAEQIDWVEADGNYVRLHTHGKRHLVRETLKAVEARLDPRQFVRVHRSAIVNVNRIVSVEPYFHGEFVLTMRDGAKLTSSRTYSQRLRPLVGHSRSNGALR